MHRRGIGIALVIALGAASIWAFAAGAANPAILQGPMTKSPVAGSTTAPVRGSDLGGSPDVDRVSVELHGEPIAQPQGLDSLSLEVRVWRGPLRLPAANTYVELTCDDGTDVRQATDGAGIAQFSGLGAGQCAVECGGVRASTTIVSASDQVLDLFLPELRRITGRVLDPNGRPHGIANLYVAERDAPLTHVGQSDESGSFSIAVPAGRWICARADGFAPSLAFRAAGSLELRLREAQSTVAIQVSQGGRPANGARLRVASEESVVPTERGTARVRFSFELIADAEGRAELAGLPLGSVCIHADSEEASGTTTTSLEAGRNHVRLALDALRMYRGTVSDRAGRAVSGALVMIDGEHRGLRATTDSEGQFELRTRTIQTKWLPDEAAPVQGAVVRAFHPDAGAAVAFVRPDEPRAMRLGDEACIHGVLTGVQDPRGLFVECSIDGERVPAYVARTGHFWAVASPDTSVDVEVHASGCGFPVARAVVTAGAPHLVEVQMPPLTTAAGRIASSRGTLVFFHQKESASVFADVDQQGNFCCDGLVPGQYRIGYQRPGGSELQWLQARDMGPGHQQLGTLPVGPSTWGDVRLALALSANLADRWIADIRSSGGEQWFAPTQFVTRDLVAQLPAGDYVARLRNAHGATTETPFTVARGEDIQLQLSDRGIQ